MGRSRPRLPVAGVRSVLQRAWAPPGGAPSRVEGDGSRLIAEAVGVITAHRTDGDVFRGLLDEALSSRAATLDLLCGLIGAAARMATAEQLQRVGLQVAGGADAGGGG